MWGLVIYVMVNCYMLVGRVTAVDTELLEDPPWDVSDWDPNELFFLRMGCSNLICNAINDFIASSVLIQVYDTGVSVQVHHGLQVSFRDTMYRLAEPS